MGSFSAVFSASGSNSHQCLPARIGAVRLGPSPARPRPSGTRWLGWREHSRVIGGPDEVRAGIDHCLSVCPKARPPAPAGPGENARKRRLILPQPGDDGVVLHHNVAVVNAVAAQHVEQVTLLTATGARCACPLPTTYGLGRPGSAEPRPPRRPHPCCGRCRPSAARSRRSPALPTACPPRRRPPRRRSPARDAGEVCAPGREPRLDHSAAVFSMLEGGVANEGSVSQASWPRRYAGYSP